MPIIISLLVAVVLFIIAYLVISSMSAKEDVVVQDRLRGLNQVGGGKKNIEDYWQSQLKNKSFKERILKPLVEKLANEIKKYTPKALYKAAEKEVEASGNFQNRGMSGFLVYVFTLTSVMLFMSVFYVITKNVPLGKAVVIVVVSCLFGFAFPIVVVKSMAAERKEAIRRAMPDVLDLLCVSVQAGMGFDGAMGKVTAKMKGPLIDECDRLLQELRMGVTRRNALLRLADRCGIKEMQLFAAALIQAEKLGVGLAQVLEIQSENMRELRRQRAREMAAKLPSKILLPLLVFIFPVIFVVALGPPIASILSNFGK